MPNSPAKPINCGVAYGRAWPSPPRFRIVELVNGRYEVQKSCFTTPAPGQPMNFSHYANAMPHGMTFETMELARIQRRVLEGPQPLDVKRVIE
jgi:hypothetical protein